MLGKRKKKKEKKIMVLGYYLVGSLQVGLDGKGIGPSGCRGCFEIMTCCVRFGLDSHLGQVS